MGDPKKQRKKYSTPGHPWQRSRIDSEKILVEEYGLKNKKEIYKSESKLKRFTTQAKNLIRASSEQAIKEEHQLMSKLFKFGLIQKDAKLDDILALDIKKILERRLQTLVYKKHLSNTIKQSRQFIVHGHISIGERKVTVPSYFVSRDEENKISFNPLSLISKDTHSERMKLETKNKLSPEERQVLEKKKARRKENKEDKFKQRRRR